MSDPTIASGESTLTGRRTLVTGGASGIGLATARRFFTRGAEVTITDIDEANLLNAAGSLPGVRTIAADLSRSGDVHALVDQTGPMDILINNAGLQHVSPVEDFDESRWDLLIAVMLTAPFLLIKQLLPGMYETGWGRIVNVASVHGLVASPNKAAYVAAKHGLLGLTKAVALEAAARCPDVVVTAICPSFVRTPLVESQLEAQATLNKLPRERVLNEVLLDRNAAKRLIEPDEIAGGIEFLCGPSAWAMNGAALRMDAGWLAH
jgi:3-hydroxybutyrate dehydrogenase